MAWPWTSHSIAAIAFHFWGSHKVIPQIQGKVNRVRLWQSFRERGGVEIIATSTLGKYDWPQDPLTHTWSTLYTNYSEILKANLWLPHTSAQDFMRALWVCPSLWLYTAFLSFPLLHSPHQLLFYLAIFCVSF